MKTELVRSMSLPKGVPVPHFDTIKEALAHVKGDETKLVAVVNKYGRQKDSLVNAREYLSSKINELGFKIQNKDGTPLTGGEKDDAETDQKHLDRFEAAAVVNKLGVTIPGLSVNGGDAKAKGASVWVFLQGLIDQHGDFPFDLNASTRTGGKAKQPKAFAITAANNIIAGGAARIAEWAKKLATGYKGKDGITIDPIAFAPFDTAAPAGSDAAATEAVKATNVLNLARAIESVEDQRTAKRAAAEYA